LAVLAGWGGDSAGMQRTVAAANGGTAFAVPTGGSVWVFALE
jgi:hypothetical protein